jgi:hypothetical protein
MDFCNGFGWKRWWHILMNYKKWIQLNIRLVIYIFLCSGCLCFYVLSKIKFRTEKEAFVSNGFNKISKNERLILEDFFQLLITTFDFGYVLYGNKPMVMVQYANPLSEDSFLFHTLEPHNLRLRKGIECWKKYCKLFPSKGFVFLFFGDRLKDSFIELLLINKARFIEVVCSYPEKFQSLFGYGCSPSKVLNLISDERANQWFTRLNYEQLGLLLGYGARNAYHFQRRAEIHPKFYGGKFTLKKLSSKPSNEYLSIEDERQQIQYRLKPLEDERTLDSGFIAFPGFLADPCSEETQHLKDTFQKQRMQMINLYRNSSFFEKTMMQYLE